MAKLYQPWGAIENPRKILANETSPAGELITEFVVLMLTAG